MKIFEIVDHWGDIIAHVQADNERQALCKYLMEHEELEDMMLWKSAYYPYEWKIAKYDHEGEYLKARKTYDF